MIRLSIPSVVFTTQPPGESGVLYWFFLSRETKSCHRWVACSKMVGVVARSAARNWLRAEQRRDLRQQKYTIQSSSPFESAFDCEELQACVDKLPERFKTCCRNDYGPVNGRSVAQAAIEEDCSQDVIKNIRRKYRTLLKKCLLSKRLGQSEGGVA